MYVIDNLYLYLILKNEWILILSGYFTSNNGLASLPISSVTRTHNQCSQVSTTRIRASSDCTDSDSNTYYFGIDDMTVT